MKNCDSASNRIVPEIEHLLPDSIKDFGSHTVAVTHIDSLTAIGSAKDQESEEESQENESAAPLVLKPEEQKSLNKSLSKSVGKTKAAKQKKQMQGMKNKKHSKFDKKRCKSKRAKHHHPQKVTK